MYKLIIVDDEAAIREGIAGSVPWEEWGFTVAGLYQNGEEALAHVEKEAPHVVLSDICMPRMDGVELMQVLNQRFPSVKIIILSGYSDFEYLNMSIKNNVFEYLLKPTDVDEFQKLFQKVKAQLDSEHAWQEELEKGRDSRHVESLNLLLKGYFDSTREPESLKELEADYGCHFDNCVVALLTPDGRLGDEERDLYRLKRDIVQAANNALQGVEGRFFLNHEEIITGVLGGAEEDLDDERVKSALLAVQKAVPSACKATVSVGVSALCTERDMLPQCYYQAKCCVRQNVFLGEESLFFYNQFVENEAPGEVSFDIDKLAGSLLVADFDAVHAEVSRVFHEFENRAVREYQYIDRICVEALFRISRWALQHNVRFEEVLDSMGAAYTDIYRCDTLQKKETFLAALLYALQLRLHDNKNGARRSSLAYRVKQCVDEEFTSNSLSLEYVAERMDKTPAHISRVFKNELGYNFSEYLTKKRLEHAADMLSDISNKVYTVAESVGYADTSNFIKVFKKHYGVSPNEYRANLIGKDAG